MNYERIRIVDVRIVLCLISLFAGSIRCMERTSFAELGTLPTHLKSYIAGFLGTNPSMELLARDIRSSALVNKSFYNAIQDPKTMLGLLKSLPYSAQAVDLAEKLKSMKVMKDEHIVAWLAEQKEKLVDGKLLQEAVENQLGRAMDQHLKNRNIDLNFQNEGGFTALMRAAINQDKAMVRALLAVGASVNRVSNLRQNALGYAVANSNQQDGDTELIQMLLKAGADVNHQNDNGTTPLMKAAERGQKNIVRLLLEAGADPLLRDIMMYDLKGKWISRLNAIERTRESDKIGPQEKEAVIQIIEEAIKKKAGSASRKEER